MRKFLLIIALFTTSVVCAQTSGDSITVNGKDYRVASVETRTKIENGMSLIHYTIFSDTYYRITYDATKSGKIVGKVTVKYDKEFAEKSKRMAEFDAIDWVKENFWKVKK